MLNFLKILFGGGKNVISDTVETFRPNAENSAQREFMQSQAAMNQFASEFHGTPFAPRKSIFDSLMDGLNRLPRPLMALGTIFLVISALVDPVWFADRMVGIAAIPEPLWWLLGSIVAFYFGGRYQAKSQQFNIDKQVAAVPKILESRRLIKEAVEVDEATTPGLNEADISDMELSAAPEMDANPALDEWKTGPRGGYR